MLNFEQCIINLVEEENRFLMRSSLSFRRIYNCNDKIIAKVKPTPKLEMHPQAIKLIANALYICICKRAPITSFMYVRFPNAGLKKMSRIEEKIKRNLSTK